MTAPCEEREEFLERIRVAECQAAEARAELEATRRRADEAIKARAESEKRVALELTEARSALEQALRTRDEFLANISHELPTPLTLILGPVRALATAEGLNDEQRRELGIVERNARTLLRTVNELLDLSNLEAGRMRADYAQVDFAALARWVASHFEDIAQERHVEFSVDAAGARPGQADPEKLQRVLFKLLSSAFKFTPSGGAIRFQVRARNGTVEFAVEDNGPGVPRELRQIIFERFRQVDASATRSFGGTGLGLSIVKEFIGLHGGSVSVDEGPAGGARFTVTMPLTAPAGAPVRPAGALDKELARTALSELHTPTRTAAAPAPNGPAGIVLVVEGNPEMNAFLTRALGGSHGVFQAFDGRDGLEQARRLCPDLVVTDLTMPVKNGEQLVQALRASPELAETRILVLAAKANERTRVEQLRGGAHDVLLKPFVAEELLARANGLIEGKRRALAQLRESHELLQAVTEGIDDAIFIKDLSGRYQMANTAAARGLGRSSRTEVLGRDDAALLDEDGAARVRADDNRALSSPQGITLEEVLGREGAQHRYLTSKAPHRNARGEVIGVLGIARDITALRHTEIELNARRGTEEALREGDRRKNDFLAMLSHELRNPLAPIRNSLYILERATPGGPQARRAQEVIARQVTHLTRLIDDLLDVTRISRGKIRLQRERVDLCDLVRRAVEDHRPMFAAAGVALEVSACPGPILASVDPTRGSQVIGNLLGNAIKFTPREGRVDLVLELEGDMALLRVRDNGAGIAPDLLGTLFEPFVQADASRDRNMGGLGLGLALVKGLIEMHGGSVSAASEGPGRGAEFTLRLPLESTASPDERQVSTKGPAAGSVRVLLIEDNVDAAQSLKDALELDGHRVVVANTGQEGLDAARVARPDVILCDIGLPGIDGFEVARRVRADAGLRPTPMVALSGYGAQEDVERARRSGFDRHIVKPADLGALERMLAEVSTRPAREPAEVR